jgi:hypothetical protein
MITYCTNSLTKNCMSRLYLEWNQSGVECIFRVLLHLCVDEGRVPLVWSVTLSQGCYGADRPNTIDAAFLRRKNKTNRPNASWVTHRLI